MTQVKDGTKVLSQLGRGNYFGERALMGGEVRNAKTMLQRCACTLLASS